MPRPVHFEIHSADPDAAIAFYEGLFGWSFHRFEGSPTPYWLIGTSGTDPMEGVPDTEPGINGGLLARMGTAGPIDGAAVNAYVVTVDVPDCRSYLDRAVAAGATVAMPLDAIPGMGWLAYFKDLDGNIVGLMQVDDQAGVTE